MTFSSEVGRELKVSELKQHSVVCIFQEARYFMATWWVVNIGATFVHFRAGEIGLEFIAIRCGEDLETITDDSNKILRLFEYLGEI